MISAPPNLITAYRVGTPLLPLVPAESKRDWMDATDHHFANRCLPMLMANQAGWWLLNTHELMATWVGGADAGGLLLRWEGDPPYPASSHFGHGVLTWHVPYLFRTPPGIALAVRGPANCPRDGIHALEGIVETDWAEATFTMNWLFTRPKEPVFFHVGEPICQLLPIALADVEGMSAETVAIESDPDIEDRYLAWAASRDAFNDQVDKGAVSGADWQRHYMRGVSPAGTNAPRHRTRITMPPFQTQSAIGTDGNGG